MQPIEVPPVPPPGTTQSPSSPPPAAPSMYTRDMEYRLNELQRRLDAGDGAPLSPAEQQEYLQLAQIRHAFEEEGARALAAGRAACDTSSSASSPSLSDSVGATFSAVARGTLFWGSLVATAAPGYVGRKLGFTEEFKHWNWITDSVVLGALPVATKFGTSGDHLQQIRRHCEQRHKPMGLVVSALTRAEMDGFGISFPRFARHEDWNRELGVTEFELLEIDDMTATGADFASMLKAVEHMRAVVDRGESVYVHCKAGKGRSWMVVVCYLCTQCGRDFESAVALVRQQRHQVSPSKAQVRFAQDFVMQYQAGRLARELRDRADDVYVDAGANATIPNAGRQQQPQQPVRSRLDALAGAQAADADDWVVTDEAAPTAAHHHHRALERDSAGGFVSC